MEEYEIAVQSAMDDTDPQLVKQAYEIINSKMTHEEKTEAIWKLFQDRRKKLTEEKAKKVSFREVDERDSELLRKK